MKALLRLLVGLCPDREQSALSIQLTESICQRSFISHQVLAKHWLIPKTQYLIPILILVFVSCGAALAQESVVQTTPAAKAETEITPLKIGDRIPDELWEMFFPIVSSASDQVQYLSLGDYKDKLIILDFWATWCGVCISSLHKLDTLQEGFNKDLMVIPTSYESKDKIRSFLLDRKIHLPSLIEETELKEYFPHKSIPHYVWLHRGVVQAITSADLISSENVVRFLMDPDFNLESKVDLDPNKPLFLSEHYPASNKLLHYSILSQGTYRGYPEGTRFRYSNGIVNGRAITNAPLLSLFELAAWHIFEKRNNIYSNRRLILEIADQSEISRSGERGVQGIINKNFNYEIVVPVENSDSLYDFMLQDLNRYTDYKGRIEKRNTTCFILTRTNQQQNINSSGGKRVNSLFHDVPAKLINQPIANLIVRLNGLSWIEFPVIDETGYNDNVDLIFNSKIENVNDLRHSLRSYGLDLVEGIREVEMLVMYDK